MRRGGENEARSFAAVCPGRYRRLVVTGQGRQDCGEVDLPAGGELARDVIVR